MRLQQTSRLLTQGHCCLRHFICLYPDVIDISLMGCDDGNLTFLELSIKKFCYNQGVGDAEGQFEGAYQVPHEILDMRGEPDCGLKALEVALTHIGLSFDFRLSTFGFKIL